MAVSAFLATRIGLRGVQGREGLSISVAITAHNRSGPLAWLADVYASDETVVMTVVPSIVHNQPGDSYAYNGLNCPKTMSSREYLSGFMTRYAKPNSMFTMSLRASSLIEAGFESLVCFNDTPLYLHALLSRGTVYRFDEAVGIYSVDCGDNMSGNCPASVVLGVVAAKCDICRRATDAGLLDDSEQWLWQQLRITTDHYLVGNARQGAEEREVWLWLRHHTTRANYLRYVLRAVVMRLRRGKLTDPRYVVL